MYRFPLALVLASIAAAAALGTAHAARYGSFKTPSGNIVCGYGGGSIGCGIESGLRPAPRNTCTDLDYSGKRLSLRTTGRAVIDLCAGDPGPFLLVDKAPVLGYGSSWRGGGITCTSRRAGLTCKNRSGHGFFMSRAHSYRF
ncbi:MAG TPA: DUF6636 domain-containing protein [Gaiellaceae bacterium]